MNREVICGNKNAVLQAHRVGICFFVAFDQVRGYTSDAAHNHSILLTAASFGWTVEAAAADRLR